MRASLREKIYIADRLKDMLTIPEEGFCSYPEGWSDKALAEETSQEFDSEISVQSVAYIRQELFGKLKRVAVKDDLEARIAELEERVRLLEELVQD